MATFHVQKTIGIITAPSNMTASTTSPPPSSRQKAFTCVPNCDIFVLLHLWPSSIRQALQPGGTLLIERTLRVAIEEHQDIQIGSGFFVVARLFGEVHPPQPVFNIGQALIVIDA